MPPPPCYYSSRGHNLSSSANSDPSFREAHCSHTSCPGISHSRSPVRCWTKEEAWRPNGGSQEMHTLWRSTRYIHASEMKTAQASKHEARGHPLLRLDGCPCLAFSGKRPWGDEWNYYFHWNARNISFPSLWAVTGVCSVGAIPTWILLAQPPHH